MQLACAAASGAGPPCLKRQPPAAVQFQYNRESPELKFRRGRVLVCGCADGVIPFIEVALCGLASAMMLFRYPLFVGIGLEEFLIFYS